jgi:hypothetical protein
LWVPLLLSTFSPKYIIDMEFGFWPVLQTKRTPLCAYEQEGNVRLRRES